MNYEETLQNLGLNKTEAKVYLTLLELGTCTVGKIADKSKIYRANIYDALKHLIKKGLVAYQQGEKSKIYETTNPNNLKLILKKKEEELNNILPELMLKRELTKNTVKTTVLEGIDSLFHILNNSLRYNSQILVYGIPKKVPNEIVKTRIPHFHNERIKRKIVMKHIYNYDAKKRINYLNSMEYTEAKSLKQEFDTDITTQVCDDEVLLIVWDKPIKIIRIKDSRLAKTYTNYFNLLWKQAKIPE